MPDYDALNEAKLVEKERTYPQGMTAREKALYRELLRKEDLHYLKEAVREDSHSPVGDWWGAQEVSD